MAVVVVGTPLMAMSLAVDLTILAVDHQAIAAHLASLNRSMIRLAMVVTLLVTTRAARHGVVGAGVVAPLSTERQVSIVKMTDVAAVV